MPLLHPDIQRRQLQAAVLYWVVLPVAVLGGGLFIDRIAGFSRIARPLPVVLGLAGLAFGLVLIWRSTHDLSGRGGGTPSPFRPAHHLVTSGIYRLCRHPMWLGYDLAALGVILLVGSPAALGITWPVMIFFSIRFLRKEERILLLRFKTAYAAYQNDVPLLLPWPRPRRR